MSFRRCRRSLRDALVSRDECPQISRRTLVGFDQQPESRWQYALAGPRQALPHRAGANMQRLLVAWPAHFEPDQALRARRIERANVHAFAADVVAHAVDRLQRPGLTERADCSEELARRCAAVFELSLGLLIGEEQQLTGDVRDLIARARRRFDILASQQHD